MPSKPPGPAVLVKEDEDDFQRMTVHIHKELYKEFIKVFPWGTRSTALRTSITVLCNSYRKHGDIILGAALSGDLVLVPSSNDKDKD